MSLQTHSTALDRLPSLPTPTLRTYLTEAFKSTCMGYPIIFLYHLRGSLFLQKLVDSVYELQ
jgi:hypothetical protein